MLKDHDRYARLMKRIRRALLYALDAGAAVVLTLMYIGFAAMRFPDGHHGADLYGTLIALCVGLPLAFRRRRPLLVYGIVLAAMVTATLMDITREPFLAVGLAAYLVGLTRPVRLAAPVLGTGVAAASVSVVLGVGVLTPTEGFWSAAGLAVWAGLVVGVSGGAGCLLRWRRAETVRREGLRARRALADERLRIARELHDIVSHNLSLIAVKAGVAAHVAEDDPREARAALRVIEETSRSALAEMRRTLGVLRSEDAPLAPAPGSGDLAGLAAEARRAGVRVEFTSSGLAGLPEGLQLAVYRIVQEALTNVVRHAAPTRCRVAVLGSAKSVTVEVTDDGPPPDADPPMRRLPGAGHGLVGMRERTMMYDGTFAAGPRPEGGFRVSVSLPRALEFGEGAGA
ncbi:hypothetical protein SRB5_66530 [Streptomyces sp. RB5]|uniref:histidine kinase n=1 Tax=Streptomyces smaragdinus TaxID=2585196 RepID=A0A7K0CUV0_9ACTN|nr:histidine kinase [Streptomyces smaragdinus]MQY16454.1 hypothetical protein [Streptomyces smaragdinus]